MQRWFLDGVVAGLSAWPPSEVPSALDHRRAGRPWWSTDAAAATLLLPATLPVGRRRLAGTALRILVALNWGVVLSRWLDREHPVLHGAGAGVALGLFEYGFVGRRRPLIRALPATPQLLDQVVFGVVAGAVLARRRRLRHPLGVTGPGVSVGRRRRPRGRRAPASTTPGRGGTPPRG